MNNILIRIKNIDYSTLLKITYLRNINIYNIKEDKKDIICLINKNDLNNISKVFNIEILSDKSIKTIIHNTLKKIENFVFLLLAAIFFVLLSNTIVKVNINSNNKELVKSLTKSLDNYNIKRFALKKDYIEINNIKNNILEEYKEKIEWLEIESIGMTYNIKLEERKIKKLDIGEGKCNVIAQSDGIITKFIANKGVVLIKNNQSVKEGDILITGQISLNDEIKADVCASGDVYAEKWYYVTIDMPTTYFKKEYTNKKRYNLLFEYDNRDYKIFKSRLQNYDSDAKEIVSILNKKIFLLTEYEYVNKEYEYDENSLNKRIDDLVIEKLNLSLLDNEKILVKNVLKKSINDSRIKIELFVTIERLISKQVTY